MLTDIQADVLAANGGETTVVTKRGWFAVLPSKNVYKLCAERFAGEEHPRGIQQEARSWFRRR